MTGPPARRDLYPEIEPYASGRLGVGDGHVLHFEQCGRADGIPVVVLHGGPGGGSSPAMRRFFDPLRWRVVLFDQRGCGRSRPLAELKANTTAHLIADLERLRTHLGIARWAIFGGSWGSTLGLAYAQAHREAVLGLILRGVFLMTRAELDWFFRGGAGALLPEAWERFLAPLSPHERSDPVAAYYARLAGPDRALRAEAGRVWTQWESDALDIRRPGDPARRLSDPAAMDALARLECHYFHHQGFFSHDGALLEGVPALAGLPCRIVQGRLDLVTPPRAAYALARAWPGAQLAIVDGAGHLSSDPGLVDGLVRAGDAMAQALG